METYTATEAAELLGVSLQTLYAYVSRGLLHSEPGSAGTRARRYPRGGVEALLKKRELRGDRGAIAEQALDWGTPVLPSAITLIAEGRLYYRGRDAVTLAATTPFETVATWLWTGDDGAVFPAVSPLAIVLPAVDALTACQVLLPLMGTSDPASWDLRPAAVRRTGAQILYGMGAVIAGEPVVGSLAGTLAKAWGAESEQAVDTVLGLVADHELNVSAFAARLAASARATPYDAVLAGLATLRGTRHGGQAERVAALFDEVGTPARAGAVLAARLRRGEAIPGFGQPLYPAGDPRGAALLALARTLRPDAMALGDAIAEAGTALLADHPTLDFGLVVLARALQWPPAAPLALFALGRTAGWIAHAIEQYEGGLIRPRARYVGPAPA